eukprot:TRINITY_DN16796_c0_g1_i1.p1 TRINITY_DN16796_c0_g1~~TRINITY_DN16796_c0_g1_i1.p1  ORF type:complete len:425 (-),score=90.17 TRINITY_DN16796_c0_g1_i1:346-1593(-)
MRTCIAFVAFCAWQPCRASSGSSPPPHGDEAVQPPPFFDIQAPSLRNAGFQQGQLAKERIRGWLASDEMAQLEAFTRTGAGKKAFEQMKSDNLAVFPEFVEELQGIAEGAGVDLEAIWRANLISELESLAGTHPVGHCSDIYAISEHGFKGGFAHGHNEDWPGDVNKFFYYVKLTPNSSSADFSSCAGMAYPGALIGWAATWNSHGIYMTQNSVFPRQTLPSGLGSVFVQRKAICGGKHSKPATSLDDIVANLKSIGKPARPWSSGASINVVDLMNRQMANVEVHEQEVGVQIVTEEMGNYSHFNMYKTLAKAHLDPPQASTLHRQARVDALPPSRSQEDVKARLSDTADPSYPIFRNMTITTAVLNGLTGDLDVWCCGHAAASGKSPLHSWNVLSFFDDGRSGEPIDSDAVIYS